MEYSTVPLLIETSIYSYYLCCQCCELRTLTPTTGFFRMAKITIRINVKHSCSLCPHYSHLAGAAINQHIESENCIRKKWWHHFLERRHQSTHSTWWTLSKNLNARQRVVWTRILKPNHSPFQFHFHSHSINRVNHEMLSINSDFSLSLTTFMRKVLWTDFWNVKKNTESSKFPNGKTMESSFKNGRNSLWQKLDTTFGKERLP